MRLLTNTAVSLLFNDPFEQQVLRSAYSYVNNLHDPLRCNSFALVVRELLRIAMDRMVPDASVKSATWFVGDKGHVTRKERYRFAVSGHLSDRLISQHQDFDTTEEVKGLVEAVGKLSKYAHISKGTYGQTDPQAEAFKQEIEDAVIAYAETLEQTQKRIQNKVWELAQAALTDEITEAIPDELESISSNTVVEYAVVEHMKTLDLRSSTPDITGAGHAEAELNYGSGDDGISSPDRYPLTFEATVDPDTLEVTIKTVIVDTASFYE